MNIYDTMVVLPKAGTSFKMFSICYPALLDQKLKHLQRFKKTSIGIEIFVETTFGMANVMDVARSGREERLEAYALCEELLDYACTVVEPAQQFSWSIKPRLSW